MNSEKIKEFVQQIIQNQYDVEEGKVHLLNAIKKFYPDFNHNSIKTLDIHRTLVEFENWLVSTITQDPMPTSAKSIWFCHFDNSITDGVPGLVPEIQLIMTGSKYSPSDKPNEWFINRIWEPQSKQSELKAYKTLSNTLKNFIGNNNDLLELIFNSFTALLVINGFDIIKHEFLIYQPEMTLACGSEASGYHVIGKLTEYGIE